MHDHLWGAYKTKAWCCWVDWGKHYKVEIKPAILDWEILLNFEANNFSERNPGCEANNFWPDEPYSWVINPASYDC